MGKTSKMQENDAQKLVIFTGKGGVGKSLLSLSYAYALAQQVSKGPKKQKVLHIELNEQSFVSAFYSDYKACFEPQKPRHCDLDNLYCTYWTWQDCLFEYLSHLLKFESMVKLFFNNPVSRNILNLAPGLSDLAILGKFTSVPRKHGPQHDFDYLVLDAPSTGHLLAMLRAPAALAKAAPVGLMVEQSRSIQDCLKSKVCKLYVVSLPEVLPMSESLELCNTLQNELNIEAEVIVNKYLNITSQKSSEQQENIGEFSNWVLSRLQQQEQAQLELQKNKISYRVVHWVLGLKEANSILAKVGHVFFAKKDQ